MNNVKLDPSDRYCVSLRKWSSQGHYLRTGFYFDGKSHNIYLHHYLIGHPLWGYEVDHINRDPLDNRKENLRFVSHAENMKNINHKLGVYWHKARHKWVAQIHENGETIYLGIFKDKKLALKTAEQRRKKGRKNEKH